MLANEFCILRRATVRSIFYKCIPCTRERADIPVELMDYLPVTTVNRSARIFIHIGVNYVNPIVVRITPDQGHKLHKIYIVLAICLMTKALHLELVNDYSSSSFIAAHQHFVFCRGLL